MAREDYWGTTTCEHCGAEIEYRYEWNNVPKYCKECNRWLEKQCANPDCNGLVKYHDAWADVHDYCDKCKGWRTKRCASCGSQIRYHNDWDRVPDHCKDCLTDHYKDCATTNCPEKVKYKPSWSCIPDYCPICTRLGGANRDPWKDPRNRVEKWITHIPSTTATRQVNQKIVQGIDVGLHRYVDIKNLRTGHTGYTRDGE